MSDLQPEMIGEILSRLPVKSLLRFRCVSKPWRSLIDSQHFINTHITRSIQSGRNQTLILTDLHSDLLYSVNFDSLDKAVELDHPVYHSVELDQTRVRPREVVVTRRSQVRERRGSGGQISSWYGPNQVWGCCNGLILLKHCLWNPATRKHSLIPEMKVKRTTITRGFGYDPATDDYKIVKIVTTDDYKFVKNPMAFWVYSLKSNSWREVPDFPAKIDWVTEQERRKLSSSSYPKMETGVFASAAVHWLVKGENDYILAFDLMTEKYRMLSQPKCEDTHSFLNLGVLNGHLCLICSYCPIGFDIWMMEEYGVEQSWTRMTLQTEDCISYPGGLTKAYARDGEKVLLVQSTNGLRWYGLKRKIMLDVQIENKPHAHETNVCLSSLVPLDEDD